MSAQLGQGWRIGVDIGGTFTDLVLADPAGTVRVFKVPTVPGDPAQGAFDAVDAAASGVGCTIRQLLTRTTLFVHGSTIATNTVLERGGAKVGMLVTDGFRDREGARTGRSEARRRGLSIRRSLLPAARRARYSGD